MRWRMALLSLWGHTWMEKRQMDDSQKRNILRQNQTKKCVLVKQVNWLKGNCVLKMKENGWW